MREAREPRSFRADAAVLGSMILAVLALYCPLALLAGKQSLLGIDYLNYHERRIRYAQEAFSSGGALPAWYTRELMGTPFWSNIQSFPFLPTRLGLMWIDSKILFPVAVNLAAVLAAVFTYLYLRRMRLGRVASAAGGWTFVAAGYFASRVLAGHLPILEAYGALPLLLWCVEGIARSDPGERTHGRRHVGLVIACFYLALCGHPQVPAYAVGAAVLYAIVQLSGRAAVRALLAMAIGFGLSGFVWWPWLRLVGRSTRILPLVRLANDVALPYWRLKAFLFPWADGWPEQVNRLPARDFVGPNVAYFWETVSYVGWIPILAAAVLLVRSILRRRWPARPWLVLAALAVGAVVLALPVAQAFTSEFRVTLLHSPPKMLYVTTFALAVALAVGVDALLRAGASTSRSSIAAAVGLLLAIHAVDLGTHSRNFIHLIDRLPTMTPEIDRWRRSFGGQRFAFDYDLMTPANRAVDDVGFFDPIILVRPYRAFLALNGLPASLNIQDRDASTMPVRALAGLGVRLVVTTQKRRDLRPLEVTDFAISYAIPDPLPRAVFLPDASVRFLDDAQVLDSFRRGSVDFRNRMFLAPEARPDDLRADATAAPPPTVAYDRPDSDHIVLRVEPEATGYVRLMESWDEGWSATLDGQPTELLVADTFAMAVRVGPGHHEVRCTFRTPGSTAGWFVTGASVALLAVLAFRLRPRPDRVACGST